MTDAGEGDNDTHIASNAKHAPQSGDGDGDDDDSSSSSSSDSEGGKKTTTEVETSPSQVPLPAAAGALDDSDDLPPTVVPYTGALPAAAMAPPSAAARRARRQSHRESPKRRGSIHTMADWLAHHGLGAHLAKELHEGGIETPADFECVRAGLFALDC